MTRDNAAAAAATAAEAGPLLAVNNIEVIYNHVILVLKGVSLTVPQRGIVALLGANGAGYTSGGEQQMVALGRALMARPQLVLLDEPSLGLAPQLVEEIFEIVARLNAETGVAFLVAEQNTNIALRYAGYGYILENGRVVMDGAAAALRENEDVKEFYLGLSTTGSKSYREVKFYRRRERWLS